jgi:predicted DNA-binding transcriptional regulator AlpA
VPELGHLATVTPIVREHREPWLDKHELAAELGCSVSWIEKRMAPGWVGDRLPSKIRFGRRMFRLSAVLTYLGED